jgi:hypothetical protein
VSWLPVAVGLAVLLLAAPSAAQRKKKGGDPDADTPKVPVAIALQVGPGRYDFTGPAVCLYIRNGGILNIPSEMFTVRHSVDKQRLNLTLYKVKTGTDMFTINVTIGASTYSVTTMKVGAEGVVLGSGTVKLAPAEKGGTLTIDAADPKGIKIAGTVRCDAFNAPAETNGN